VAVKDTPSIGDNAVGRLGLSVLSGCKGKSATSRQASEIAGAYRRPPAEAKVTGRYFDPLLGSRDREAMRRGE